jgi:hypothetical protein
VESRENLAESATELVTELPWKNHLVEGKWESEAAG